MIDVVCNPERQLPETVEPRFEAEDEVRRLVDAARGAAETFAARRRQRRVAMISWIVLGVLFLAPFAGALAFPESTVRLLPATISVYSWAGWDVNIYGLTLRRVETQHLNADGTPVIAIKGEITNISHRQRKIPWLRFGLLDASGKEVYSWHLDSNVRSLQPGETTNFVTRIASPPASASEIQIRFARLEEIGSTVAP